MYMNIYWQDEGSIHPLGEKEDRPQTSSPPAKMTADGQPALEMPNATQDQTVHLSLVSLPTTRWYNNVQHCPPIPLAKRMEPWPLGFAYPRQRLSHFISKG